MKLKNILTKFQTLIILAVSLAVLYAAHLVFMVVPNERIMGPIQRVFYFHVGSAVACYCAAAVVLLGSLMHLATREIRYDYVSQSAAEVGLLFCSITLISGMIWGKVAWNTWFEWREPRLVTFLLLWIIFLSLNLFRSLGDPERVAGQASALGILSAVTVPLVVFSVKLLPQSAQLHPQVVENSGLKHPSYWTAFFVSMAALTALQFLLIWLRWRIAVLERSKNA